MSISAQVADGEVTVTGETDLPDGAVVLAQAVQWDEWQRATASGVTPDANTSPWVVSQLTIVIDGRFSATLPIDRGRLVAVSRSATSGSTPRSRPRSSTDSVPAGKA